MAVAQRSKPKTRKAEGPDFRGFDLWRSAMAWQRAVNRTLKPLGLTHTQYLVLAAAKAAIDEAGDAVSQQTIARRAGLDRATTSNVMQSLERRSLVDRGGDGFDARLWRVFVTGRGAALVRKATRRVAGVEWELFG